MGPEKQGRRSIPWRVVAAILSALVTVAFSVWWVLDPTNTRIEPVLTLLGVILTGIFGISPVVEAWGRYRGEGRQEVHSALSASGQQRSTRESLDHILIPDQEGRIARWELRPGDTVSETPVCPKCLEKMHGSMRFGTGRYFCQKGHVEWVYDPYRNDTTPEYKDALEYVAEQFNVRLRRLGMPAHVSVARPTE